jgi:hypothetical protein
MRSGKRTVLPVREDGLVREKLDGWFGISAAERIAGHQRVINKGNWQIDRLIDQYAVPTTYVDMANASIAVKRRTGSARSP